MRGGAARLTIPPMRTLALLVGLMLPAQALGGPAEDAQSAEARGDHGAATDAWRRAIEAEPGQPEHYEALGRLQLRTQDSEGAVTTFERLVERVPDYVRGRYRLAFALRKAGRYPEAAAAYRAYVERAPEDPDGRFGLAETLKQMGDGAGALEAYRAYVQLESRPSEAKWVARANEEIARLQASEVVEPGAEAPIAPPPAPVTAEANAEAAPPPDGAVPGDPDQHFAAGRFVEARAAYRKGVAEVPDAPGLRYRLAVTAALLGDAAEAEQQAAHAARLDPGNRAANDLAAASLARMSRTEKAGDGGTAPATPTVDEVELCLREGRVRTAERLAAAAIQRSTDAVERARLHRARARALLVLDRVEEALGALKSAAGLGQSDPGLWLDLAEAVRRAGDRDGARRLYELAAQAAPAGHPVAERARIALRNLGSTSGP